MRGEASIADVIGASARAALAALDSSEGGLTADEAAERLRAFGPNRLPQAREAEPVRQLLAQFVHFFAVMLWIAAGLSFVGKMPQLGWHRRVRAGRAERGAGDAGDRRCRRRQRRVRRNLCHVGDRRRRRLGDGIQDAARLDLHSHRGSRFAARRRYVWT